MPDLPTLRIGGVSLPSPLVLSPMAGFSDQPFRVLCRRHGAGLVCSEMVSASSLERGAAKTLRRADTCDEERPTSIQVFGTEPEECARAAAELAPDCEILGFNMGCPAHQIRAAGCGAALLDDPERCVAIVERIKEAADKPLLVKIRAGNRGPMDVAEFGRRLEAAGADGIIFHARTAAQNYSGRSDWNLIQHLTKNVSIPVVANGDVVDGPSARACLDATGASGVAIGRAALGDPRLFGRILHYLETGEELPPAPLSQRIEDFLAYFDHARTMGYGMPRILTQAQRFTRGLQGGAEFRFRLQEVKEPEAIRARFESLLSAG